jgi:ATP-dependent protease ClpP protease subunit
VKELYIRFLAPVVPETTSQLFQVFDAAIQQKYDRLHLMLSSPGGSVFHGLSVYNFLRGAPIETHTYNFGSVDSIGIVLYCAGSRRYSVPHARFLIHGVMLNFQGAGSLDEKSLEERLKGLQIDQENIARVIADTTEKPHHQITTDMHSRTTLSPTQAKDYGLVHDIQSALFPAGANLAVIGEPIKRPQQVVPQVSSPPAQAFTQSRDLDDKTPKKHGSA